MRKLIAAGKDGFAKSLKESAAALGIDVSEVMAVDGYDREQFHRDFSACLNSVWKQDEAVILVDLQASAFVQEAMLDLEKRSLLQRSLILFGMNVPGMIAAVQFLNAVDTLEELAKTVESEAKAGIGAFLSQN